MSAAVAVRGWCPGAYRPMMSGDGLVVRIRPRMARLERAQVLGLCELAGRFGSGFLDLTNRANVQIRGVAESGFEALLAGLGELDLLDPDAQMEGRRNIVVTPFWTAGDLTCRLAELLNDALTELPELPSKFGFCVDCGSTRLMAEVPADIRIESGPEGPILRLDGAQLGRPVPETELAAAVVEMAGWFAVHRTPETRRMSHVLNHVQPPAEWTVTPPSPAGIPPKIGKTALGTLVGAAFGQLDAGVLARAVRETDAQAIRLTPWRLFLLEGAAMPADPAFVSSPEDPILGVDACPGAPFCSQATVETRALARTLAGRMDGGLHVSGCAKGCARPNPARTTLIGREGRFDLVKDGCAWDAPIRSGLTPEDILAGTD